MSTNPDERPEGEEEEPQQPDQLGTEGIERVRRRMGHPAHRIGKRPVPGADRLADYPPGPRRAIENRTGGVVRPRRGE